MSGVQVFSPVDNRPTWTGRWASVKEIDRAYEKSRGASRRWANTSLADRISCMRRYAQSLENHKDGIAMTITLESGKPLWESKQEVLAAKSKVENSIDALQRRRSETETGSEHTRNVIRYHPLGTVLVLGPYNLPLHLPGAHIVPSLLAGNTVVFKPSEKTPAVGDWIQRCWQEAGLPEGVLQTLQGAADVAKHVVAKSDLGGVFFTGSYRGGLELHRQLAGRPECLLALEMGGNNPLVVDDVRDINAAVHVIISSCFLTSGQRCTCARRLVVVDSDANRFLLEKLTHSLAKIRVDSPLAVPEPFMGCLVSSDACDAILNAQQRIREDGGRILVECRRLGHSWNSLTPGLIESGDDSVDEEHFGPLATVFYASDFDEAMRLANATRYGLSAGLLSDDKTKFQTFATTVKAGVINWNSPTTGASGSMPFGGVGASGNYRPSGYFAADYCSYPSASVQVTDLKMVSNTLPGLEDVF